MRFLDYLYLETSFIRLQG